MISDTTESRVVQFIRENRGCNTPPVPGPVLCVYRTAAGELQVRVQPRPDGWYVDQAIVSPE